MKAFVVTALALLTTSTALAELDQPEESPHATVHQTIGLTKVSIDYHRPAVQGRQVWGKLVPYGEVWRAGANQNTTITFSTDVKIGGKPLRAGTYGLHMIPTQKDWTVIFSTVTTAWGSYSYDQKEDALRVTVTPRALPAVEERMVFKFDEPAMTKATLVLAWEKLAVPVTIEVDTPKVVMANMRAQLRGVDNYRSESWTQAASYWLKNGGNLDEALKFADKSIGMRPAYGSYMIRAAILDKKGKTADAKAAREKAITLASEADLNQAGYALVQEKKLEDAIAMFKNVVAKYPDSWNAHDSLAEALAMKGDKQGAIDAYGKALALTKDPVQKKRIEKTIAGLKK
jgi:Tfp pilus assembly protein PilF